MNKEKKQKAIREEIKGTIEYLEKYFPIVKASSLDENFLKYEPETERQRKFKDELIEAIKSGVPDFRAQRMDASIDKKGNICFRVGARPAIGESAKWWKKVAKDFMPERGSRLGTRKERIVFLGVLIKYLIEEKQYEESEAWEAVCDHSEHLGHYSDSEDAKYYDFEDTGSRQIGEWFDLGNTCKIITKEENDDEYFIVGGAYYLEGNEYPLADMECIEEPEIGYQETIGWIVIPL